MSYEYFEGPGDGHKDCLRALAASEKERLGLAAQVEKYQECLGLLEEADNIPSPSSALAEFEAGIWEEAAAAAKTRSGIEGHDMGIGALIAEFESKARELRRK